MKKFCVIGHPVAHSLSPKLHNAWFREAKIDARYQLADVKPENLASFMRKFRKEYRGANVTIPHKEKIIKHLDVVDPVAKRIGAVNTIINKNGKLFGYNTDIVGAMEALKKAGALKSSKKATVLGAGGAARAVVYGLKKAGIQVTILNRTVSNAKKLAKEFKIKRFGSLQDFDAAKCDIVINTTSVGMWPNVKDSPLPQLKSELKKLSSSQRKKIYIMDIIYRPKITKLLRDTKKSGCKIITGEKMFLGQAKSAFAHFKQAAK